jgi:hypothetical protein
MFSLSCLGLLGFTARHVLELKTRKTGRQMETGIPLKQKNSTYFTEQFLNTY